MDTSAFTALLNDLLKTATTFGDGGFHYTGFREGLLNLIDARLPWLKS
ncbi:hypothetical protein [Vibrio salinus]|nr:hypothetical protein [Vibrio salinus]MCE0494156.1 hypothetical protein [Vibrio salinus]